MLNIRSIIVNETRIIKTYPGYYTIRIQKIETTAEDDIYGIYVTEQDNNNKGYKFTTSIPSLFSEDDIIKEEVEKVVIRKLLHHAYNYLRTNHLCSINDNIDNLVEVYYLDMLNRRKIQLLELEKLRRQ